VAASAVSLALVAGNNMSLSTATAAGALTVTVSNLLPAKISFTQNMPLQEIGLVTQGSVTTTGSTAAVQPFNSSLFLQRIFVEAAMTLTEADIAIGLGFPATNSGAGSMSQSFVVYSFGNSTSLASVMSASGSSTWASGTATVAGQSYTQSQGGWSGSNIKPFTFASTSLTGGEYVVGHLFAFAGANTSWTVSMFGGNAALLSTASISALTNVTTATLGAMSSGGLAAVSAHTASTSAAATVFTAAQSFMLLGGVGSTASLSTTNVSTFTDGSRVLKATATAASVVSLLMNTGIGGVSYLSSGGLSAGSFIGTSGSIGAVTAVGQASASATFTFATSTLPNFGYIGTQSGATTGGLPTAFSAGIMSTGGIPTSIALTSTAVTMSGSFALIQPWFALIGN
jgi:hypothetical protein